MNSSEQQDDWLIGQRERGAQICDWVLLQHS